MGRNMKWDRYTPRHEPWYDQPLMPRAASRPPRKRTGMVKHPKGTPLKFAVVRSHNWAPLRETPGRSVLTCLACGERKVYEAGDRGLVQVAGSTSSICRPRTEAARAGKEVAPGKCGKCGSWMNRKFGVCSNRSCPPPSGDTGVG